ncbi:hypothetical protein ADK60_29850 [Streptomyces sp. XY431]|nr:hypothetical protein ADK60_29850 [Streptomyces sp. XY431]
MEVRAEVPVGVAAGRLSRPGKASPKGSGRWWAAAWPPPSSCGSGWASAVAVIEVAFRQREAGADAAASPGIRALARVPPTLHTGPLSAV